jgi:hypothetical protein
MALLVNKLRAELLGPKPAIITMHPLCTGE